jgi:tetratricopeptide (TPR) repeat protein
MKRYLFSLCFLAFIATNTVFSQAKLNVDSLTAVLSKYPKDDTEKAKLLIALSDALIEVNATEGIAYSDKALAILANFNAPELKADALKAKAEHLRVNNKLTEALDVANKALETYEQLRRTQKIAETHQLLGLIYYQKGDAANALKNFERALVLCEQIGDWKTKLASLNGVGLVYMQSKDNQKAITYYEQAVALAQKLNDHKAEARSLGNIGTAYDNLDNNTQSIEYIKKAVVINESAGNQYYLIYDYRDLGNIYMKLMDIAKALDYYNKALTIAVEIGNKSQEANLIK